MLTNIMKGHDMDWIKKTKLAMRQVLMLGREGLPDTCEWEEVFDQYQWIKDSAGDIVPEDWEVLGELIQEACLSDGLPNLME